MMRRHPLPLARRVTVRARAWNSAMHVTAQTPHRSHLGRAALVALLAAGAVLGLGSAMSANVLAANFATGSTPTTVRSDRLNGQGMGAFLHANARGGTSDTAMIRAGFRTVQANGLCIIAAQTLGVAPATVTYYVRITAGEPVNGSVTGTDVLKADNLYFELADLAGTGTLGRMNLGKAAETMVYGYDTVDAFHAERGIDGSFGFEAESLVLSDVQGGAYALELVGQINLPNLQVRVFNQLPTCTQ